MKSLVKTAVKPVCEAYSLIFLASIDKSVDATLAFIETASVFLPFKSKVTAPLTPSSNGPSITLLLAVTLTPVPANSDVSLLAT